MYLNNNITRFGESAQQSFEPIKSPCITTTPLQITATVDAASATQTRMSFQTHQQDQLQIDLPVWSIEFPITTDSSFLFCQASEDNYSASTTKQDQLTSSQFTSSFQSVAESFMSSSEDSIFSSEKYSKFPSCSGNYDDFLSDNTPIYEHFAQQHQKVLDDDASLDKRSLEISFQRTQCDSCIKPDKQSLPCGVAFATTSNCDSRGTATRKRRIRWTKDLHEPFIMIVNHLGGPEKAKPKAILEMMGSDVLTISHIKSHLQKYRSTSFMHKALKGRSDEGHKKDGITELQVQIQMQIEESRQLQLEVQRSNHRQLEMQRNLQLLIEQQRKQLKLMLDHHKQRTKLEKIPDSELEVTMPEWD